VSITDLDGDNVREVLVAARTPNRELRSKLHCFNADGSLRWVRQLDDRQLYGAVEYGPPWSAHKFLVTRAADGKGTVWAQFIHGLAFPTVLEEIDASGRVLSRYWSNGYIDWLSEGRWQGRPVLLVGAVNNEHRGAALAVLGRTAPSGTAPAMNPAYRCTTCGPGSPLAFLVFPPTPIGAVRGEGTSVIEAWVAEDQHLVANVRDTITNLNASGDVAVGDLIFTLDDNLRPERVEVTRQYRQLHDALFRAGRLPRPYRDSDEADLLRVLRWDGLGFAERRPLGEKNAGTAPPREASPIAASR
jgi:hypothetical protein